MFRFPVLVCLLVLSMGCSTTPEKINANAPSGPGNDLSVIEQTPLGANFVWAQQMYQVIDSYTAASGRECRTLFEQRSATTRVACRDQNARWYLRETLTQSPAAQPQVAGMTTPRMTKDKPTAAVTEPPAEAVELKTEAAAANQSEVQNLATVAVAENENLWRFSKRVTGNALNWQAIATLNGISNVNALRVGQQLRIPAQLQVLARTQTPTPAEGS